jgi:uncharacterized protein YidB (DUF937 family)
MAGAKRAGFNPVLMVLLPVVLKLLRQRRAAGAATRGRMGAGPRGGLGGLGGLAAGGAAAGGLGLLLERLARRGYGDQARTWVAPGPNAPLPPQAVDEVFEPEELDRMASEAGLSREQTREGLAQLLPEVVDDLTPEGQLPPEPQLDSRLDEVERRLAGR